MLCGSGRHSADPQTAFQCQPLQPRRIICRATNAVDFSIVIATYNRASDLPATLRSLARLSPRGSWEVIVVDNNSTDDTRQVVEDCATSFPVRLRCLFEREQGRSPALNAGIRVARGDIIVTTDDDVRVEAV